jgi:hypothetical protein
MPRSKPRLLHVTIVSNNPETLDGLATYLGDAGVTVRGTRRIETCLEVIPPASSAVVFFPDDFSPRAVDAALVGLRRCRSTTLSVLVTSDPRRFEKPGRERHLASLVMPKPAWGWSVLDAIRGRLEGGPSENETKR